MHLNLVTDTDLEDFVYFQGAHLDYLHWILAFSVWIRVYSDWNFWYSDLHFWYIITTVRLGIYLFTYCSFIEHTQRHFALPLAATCIFPSI